MALSPFRVLLIMWPRCWNWKTAIQCKCWKTVSYHSTSVSWLEHHTDSFSATKISRFAQQYSRII